MNDRIVRAIAGDGFMNAVFVLSTGICERARRIHKTLPTATAALGRLLSAASMMGCMQKVDDGSLTLQVRGDGPLGTLLAVSDARGNVRGFVSNPQISLLEKYRGKLDVGAAVGNGMLTVIRDLRLKEPYVGSIELTSGEIAEDIAAYFAQSEQIPTVCALGVLVDTDQSVRAAGGYIVQLLPGASGELIDRIEEAVRQAGPVSAFFSEKPDPEALLERVLGGFNPEILETERVEYRCYCSRERVRATLVSLGRDDLQQIVESGETVHVGCQFCDADYSFAPEEVAEILSKL